jgi:hypothetical protein
MPANNNLIQGLLNLLLENTNFANVGDATGLRGSSSAGNFYFSLHSSDPGATGNQTTNEVSFTSYARATLARTSGNFTQATNTFSLAATLNFVACTGGSATATYAGIGTSLTGSGILLWSGSITPSLSITNGITPQLTTGTTFTFT